MNRLLAAAFTATLAGLPASAFEIGSMTESERETFREEVRSFLLDHPEVLLEAIGVLEAREAEEKSAADAAVIAAKAAAIYEDGHSWVGGNPDGDVTVVEFMDYKCGYCRRAHPVVEELLSSDGNIRLIVKEFPILGEESVLASRFAIAVKAAHGDDAYKAVHDTLIALRSNVTEESLLRIADHAGWDGAALLEAMASPEIGGIIQANRALATELGISGTPSFVVGDTLLRGYLPLDGMEAVVAEARGG